MNPEVKHQFAEHNSPLTVAVLRPTIIDSELLSATGPQGKIGKKNEGLTLH